MDIFVCLHHSLTYGVIGVVLVFQNGQGYSEHVRNAHADDFIKRGLIALFGKRYELRQLPSPPSEY
jgi:hypothetical protein